MNIPNSLTLFRIALIPCLILIFYLSDNTLSPYQKNLTATLIFLFAAITDWLDGYLARKLKITSARGSQLDSFGDQITFIIGLIGLFYFENDFIKKNLTILLIAFVPYIIQMLIAFYKYGKATAFHTYLAKTSAVLQSLFILWSLFFNPEYSLFYIMIIIGILETIEEVSLIFIYDTWVSDVKSIFLAFKDKRRKLK